MKYFKRSKQCSHKKVNKPIVNILSIAHSGRVPSLLKKSAKLKRSRAAPKIYASSYQLFNNQEQRTSTRSSAARRGRESTYSTPTIEMRDINEEEKEAILNPENQRFIHSRRE